jgi:alpha-1,2-mannosyltransferase
MADITERTGPNESAFGHPRPAVRAVVRRRIAISGGVLLCLGWLAHGWQLAIPGLADRSGGIKGADYIQFYVMGTQAREGQTESLYDTQAIAATARRSIAPNLDYHPARNPYGPQIALIFSPLSALPFLKSLAVFSTVSSVAYAFAIWLLWRHSPGLTGESVSMALLAAACPAVLSTLRFGQISNLTLLAPALAVAVLAAGRPLLAGAALGLLAYKPQLLIIFAPVLVLARDWRCLLGLGITAMGQLAVAWETTGGKAVRDYVGTLYDVALHPELVMLYPENSHSVRGCLRLLGVSQGAATWVVILLVLLAVPPLARFWRSGAPPVARIGLLVLTTLLLAPHVLTYDLLLLVIPIVAMADWASTHPADRRIDIVTALAVALYAAPFSSVLAQQSHLQLSTLAMVAASWIMWRVHTPETQAVRL